MTAKLPFGDRSIPAAMLLQSTYQARVQRPCQIRLAPPYVPRLQGVRADAAYRLQKVSVGRRILN